MQREREWGRRGRGDDFQVRGELEIKWGGGGGGEEVGWEDLTCLKIVPSITKLIMFKIKGVDVGEGGEKISEDKRNGEGGVRE